MAGPENEPLNPDEAEEWEEEAPRSIFARTWFRVVIVVLAVGAVASIAIPYLMDSGNMPGSSMSRVAAPPAAVVPPRAVPPSAPPAPAAPPVASTPAVPPKAEAPKPTQPEAPKQVAQAKPEPPKVEKATESTPKTAASKTESKTAAKARTKSAPAAPKSDAPGDLWVQVGAFRDPGTAKKVADGLKAQGFEVAQSTLTRGGGAPATGGTDGMPSGPADKYDVVVAGTAADITKKLSDKGLSAETVRDGAVVRPSLPLRDAVTLSNDLRGEGFAVSVRRVATGVAAPAPAPVASGGETLYRVRVGTFADRTAANAAIEKLRALGYTPFVARGRE